MAQILSGDMNNTLWYEKPANAWIQGMPLGNGRMGAMVLGKLRNEDICLNDDTMWLRGPANRNNPDALKYLPEMRRLLLNGEVEKAAALGEAAMIGTPKKQTTYQPLGELCMIFTDINDDGIGLFRQGSNLPQQALRGQVENYRRSLELAEAVASVEYAYKQVTYRREHFISGADGVFVTRVAASEKNSVNMMVTLFRRYDAVTEVMNNSRILMKGQCGASGSKFRALLDICAPGGTVTPIGNYLCIEGADEVVLILANETDIRCENYVDVCEKRLEAAKALGYSVLRERHIRDYQSYYNRMEFTLGKQDDTTSGMPTDRRLNHIRAGGGDLRLVAQYFNFGRYLFISASRPGSMPANLQGIWNDSFVPPWDSKYTININIQMNYWLAESCGLGDCHVPLLDMVNRARTNGRVTAKEMYGANGFVIHHNLDMWCDTAPLDHTRAGLWPMGGAWLACHFWEHYAYAPDRDFLETAAFPVMTEAAEFLLDYMFPDEHGQLLSGPSISPENRYITPSGQIGYLCLSPAMDTQIITGLFTRCIAAAEVLNRNDAIIERIRNALPKLPPMKVSRDGSLQEWLLDYEEGEPGHRHISHLFAVYPDNQINERTPELFEAARNTLTKRLRHDGGGTGWSMAWIISFWARFKEGNAASDAVTALLKNLTADSLLDIHPPYIFQIDGNLGAVAGIIEMLAQTNGDAITLLPALPSGWDVGSVKGLRLKDGLCADISWDVNGQSRAVFYSKRAVRKTVVIGTDKSKAVELVLNENDSYCLDFKIKD